MHGSQVAIGVVLVSLLAGTGAGAQEPSPAPRSGDMVVTLLGTGNPRPTPDRLGPSILVEAGTERLLIDAGRGCAMRLFEIGDTALLSGITALLLTHLHSDHVVGLPDLWLTGWLFGRTRPLEVIGPQGTAGLAEHLARAYEYDVRMRRDLDEKLPAGGAELRGREVEPGLAFDRGGVRVRAFPVDHGPVRPSFGYRVEYAGRSLVVSGDTRYTESMIAASRGADVIIHEVVSPEVERKRAKVQSPATIERIIARHTPPEEAGRIFTAAGPRLAVYSHIVPSPATAADLIEPTRRTWSGPLEVGFDLMQITIGDRIVVERRARVAD
jgi:ribonuclease Z